MQRLLLGVVGCWIGFSLWAQTTADEGSLPPHIVLSYTPHPVIEGTLIPYLRQAYQNLGVQVDFVAIGDKRALLALASGLVDGDVAKLGDIQELVPDLILVDPPLEMLTVSLRCRPGIACKEEDLFDRRNTVYIPAGEVIRHSYQKRYRAQLYQVQDWVQLKNMYAKGRIDRFLWADGVLYSPEPIDDVQVVPLNIDPPVLFHVLNQKHAHLARRVSEQLVYLIFPRAAE